MNEFAELKKFIRNDCKLNVIDISNNLSIDSYMNYIELWIKYPENVYISNKNAMILEAIASRSTPDTHNAKYLLIKNDNYHITAFFWKT